MAGREQRKASVNRGKQATPFPELADVSPNITLGSGMVSRLAPREGLAERDIKYGSSRKMRIVHMIVGLGDGGAERTLYKLVTSDKINSHSIISFTSYGKYGPLLSAAGIPTIAIDGGGSSMWASLSSIARLVRELRTMRPEVLHAWMPHAAIVASVLKKILGAKRVFWSIRASDYGSGFRSFPTRLIVRMLAHLSHAVPSKILVVGRRALEKHADLGFSRQKMRCIPNGYSLPNPEEPDHWQMDTDGPELHRGYLVFGMMARYHPQKDHFGLLRGFSMVKKGGAAWHLKLAGEGMDSSNEELVAEISRLGLTHNVVLLGPTTNPDAFYRSLNIHILSSSFGEGFPNVVAESMLNKVPNLVTDVGDSAEIVGDSGWVVRPNSATDLAAAIESILDSESAEIQARGLRASARIKQSYLLEDMVQSHVREYRRRHLFAFPRYSELGASSRVRMFQYEETLSDNGWDVTFFPFADDSFLLSRYRGQRAWRSIARSYLRRLRELRKMKSADLVWVEKEFIPWAPAWLEKLFIPKSSKVVYDFDDAVHEQFRDNPHLLVRLALGKKVPSSVGDSLGVISGNETLQRYFDGIVDFNSITVPSAIDHRRLRPEPEDEPAKNRPFIFGWIGTPVTFRAYVEHLMPIFESTAERIGGEFWVIGAGSTEESTKYVKYRSWSHEEESALLNTLDVGIMPLVDDPWSRGKCGYKLLQYMAVGKAVIASPVGVNEDIVTHGETGYFVREAGDWDRYLTMLSSNRQLSRAMGEKGVERVTSFYSSAKTGTAIVDYFNQVLGPEAS